MTVSNDRQTLRNIGVAVGALMGLALVLIVVSLGIAQVVQP